MSSVSDSSDWPKVAVPLGKGGDFQNETFEEWLVNPVLQDELRRQIAEKVPTEDVEDVLQEVLTKATIAARLQEVKGKKVTNYKAFAKKICRSEIANFYRQKNRNHSWFEKLEDPDGISSDTKRPDEILEDKELDSMVQEILLGQPEWWVKAWYLHTEEGMSYQEIAEFYAKFYYEVSPQTIGVWIFRLRQALKAGLQNYLAG